MWRLRKHRGMVAALVVVLLVSASGGQPAGDTPPFPEALTCWRPLAANPLFTGAGGNAWDQKIRERGWILIENGRWHLWYTGYNPERSPRRMLGHATSVDGINWQRDDRPQYQASWVEDMCVVREGDHFLLFAEGEGDIAHQLVSTDGREWVELGPLDIRKRDGRPIDSGPRGTPTVWIEGTTWYLFYERGDRGVWLATSTDRRVWTNVSDDPVIARGPEAYDRHAVALNQVIKLGEWYYAVYHANAHMPWKDWSTCLARSKDLIHWEKYPDNPIVGDNASSGLLVDPDGDGPASLRLYTMHPDVRAYEPVR